METTKTYQEPDHEIIHLNNTDVIAASTDLPPTDPINPSGGGNSPLQDILNDILNK